MPLERSTENFGLIKSTPKYRKGSAMFWRGTLHSAHPELQAISLCQGAKWLSLLVLVTPPVPIPVSWLWLPGSEWLLGVDLSCMPGYRGTQCGTSGEF